MKVLLTATVQSHIAQFHMPLIEMLKKDGHEVHVAARNNLNEKNGLKLKEVDEVFDISFERFPLSKRNIKAYRQLKVIVSNNQYDIIHCNTPMGGVISRLAARQPRKKGTKVFYTAHGFHFYKGSPLKNWIVYYPAERLLARYTDKLITITQEDYELANKNFKTDVYHIHGVGADSKRYFPYSRDRIDNIKRELGYSKDQLLLVCTGELNKNKNQCTVIRAIAEVKKAIPNLKLLLAGNGPNEKGLKDLVEKLNLTENVDFLGYRTDLEKYVNISDIVISASFREGLPLNIMEAMLCEKPVIASVNRGHKELVRNNITGFLLEAEDTEGFAKSILKIETQKKLAEKFGKAGGESIRLFTAENVLKELHSLYF